MSIEQDEIVLRPDGSAIRRTYQEYSCNVVDKIAEAMGENAVRVCKRVGLIDGIPFHLVRSAKETYAVMVLPHLILTAPVKAGTDGLVHPQFDDATGDNPTIPLKWPAPPGMALVFAARVAVGSGNANIHYKDSCYLLAMDSGFKSYMLPLPNLFETGYVCMGEFSGVAPTVQESFTKAYNQLMQSKWNADLYSSDRKSKVTIMMAFKPEADQFVSQPYAGWQSLLGRCESPAIELLKGALKP